MSIRDQIRAIVGYFAPPARTPAQPLRGVPGKPVPRLVEPFRPNTNPIVKPKPARRKGGFSLNIVGESYRQAEIAKCRVGEVVDLVREPHNRHDRNAVAVVRRNGQPIGYLARDRAEWIGGHIDDGMMVDAEIEFLTGGTRDKPSRGVVLHVWIEGIEIA